MINLVHIVYDDKFIDDTYEVFNSLNRKDLTNRYVFIRKFNIELQSQVLV